MEEVWGAGWGREGMGGGRAGARRRRRIVRRSSEDVVGGSVPRDLPARIPRQNCSRFANPHQPILEQPLQRSAVSIENWERIVSLLGPS